MTYKFEKGEKVYSTRQKAIRTVISVDSQAIGYVTIEDDKGNRYLVAVDTLQPTNNGKTFAEDLEMQG